MDDTVALDNAARRAEYEAQFASLARVLPTTPASRQVERFLALESRLDAGMVEVKAALLVSSLLTREEDDLLGVWIYRQHAQLARLGFDIAQNAVRDDRVEPGRAMRLVALALLHWGEAVKWELIAGRPEKPDYAALHGLARMALERDCLQASGKLRVDGLERTASIEALYFRTLLLDRFASGNLSRQQIEVLDAWLWEWSPWLASSAKPRGAVMRADLDSQQGLVHGARTDAGPSLHLPLAPLEAQRQSVIDEFHAGRVVPARGRASQIRLEAHVAVLVQLERTFAGDESRAPRRSVDRKRVQVWVGLTEIVRELTLELHAQRVGARREVAASRGDKYDEIYDRPQRWTTLRDESETGWRLAVTESDAPGLSVGELVALRFDSDPRPVLAVVVRRIREAEGDASLVGVQRLSDPMQPFRLCHLRTDAGAEGTYLFVPGGDEWGRRDSFVVPYRLLETQQRFFVKRGERDYAFGFNRVRKRGRGWALAGFEMVDAAAWEIMVA